MKRLLIFISVVVLVIIVAALLYFLVFNGGKPSTPANGVNPFATSSNAGSLTGSGLPVTLKDGSTVSIPDPTKIPQPEGYTPSQGYQVAGTDSGDFQILYFPASNGGADEFLISILAEPIGHTRLAAEQALQQKLNLTNTQMCQLPDVEVYVNPGVNDTYAGRNLGLSFCPGATKLP